MGLFIQVLVKSVTDWTTIAMVTLTPVLWMQCPISWMQMPMGMEDLPIVTVLHRQMRCMWGEIAMTQMQRKILMM